MSTGIVDTVPDHMGYISHTGVKRAESLARLPQQAISKQVLSLCLRCLISYSTNMTIAKAEMRLITTFKYQAVAMGYEDIETASAKLQIYASFV